MKKQKIIDVIEQNIQKIYELRNESNNKDIIEICSELTAMNILIKVDGID